MGQTWPCSLDYSYARPSMGELTGYGAEAVLRYLGTDGRCINTAERDQLRGAGLTIGLIFETYANRPLDGYNAGYADGGTANRYADALGADGDDRIYYAVDFQPTTDQLNGPVTDYFYGVVDAGGRPPRAYGCASVMERLCGQVDLFPDSWQCAAWSYPGTAPGEPLYDGGYTLVLSPWASILQTIGFVIGDSCDHNNDFVSPPPGFMGGPASGDWLDMASQEDVRKIVADELGKANLKWGTNHRFVQVGDKICEPFITGNGVRALRWIGAPEEMTALTAIDGVADAGTCVADQMPGPVRDVVYAWPIYSNGQVVGRDTAPDEGVY